MTVFLERAVLSLRSLHRSCHYITTLLMLPLIVLRAAAIVILFPSCSLHKQSLPVPLCPTALVRLRHVLTSRLCVFQELFVCVQLCYSSMVRPLPLLGEVRCVRLSVTTHLTNARPIALYCIVVMCRVVRGSCVSHGSAFQLLDFARLPFILAEMSGGDSWLDRVP